MGRIVSTSIVLVFVILSMYTGVSADVITHMVDIDDSDIKIEELQSGDYYLSIAGYRTTNYIGLPAIPYKVVSLLLPQWEEVSSYYLEGGSAVILGQSVSLSVFEGDLLDDGTTRGLSVDHSKVIGEDSIFPSFRVRHLGTETYKGYRIASFAVYPVRYNMVTGLLAVDTNIILTVETRPALENDHVERVRYVKGFRERSRRGVEVIVSNPSEASSYVFNEIVVDGGDRGFCPGYLPGLDGSEVSYLIITNEEMEPVFSQLAEWKTKKGVPAVVKTVEWITQNYRSGADPAETIRNFIVEAYAKWGVEWVLLGGDTDIIPARYGYVTFYTGDFIPTDLYYSCLDGSWNADGDSIWGEAYAGVSDPGDETDLYSEVFVGRMPVSTYSEAEILVGKSMNYEGGGETASKNKFLLLGEVIFPTDYTPGDNIILDGAEILQSVYQAHFESDPDIHSIRLYEDYLSYPGSYALNGISPIDSMNAGTSHVMHAGHGGKYNMAVGTGSILNYDAAGITSGDATFSMYLMNCTNVAFDTDCLAEYFLLNPNGGAFAVTGSSRSAFPSASRPYLDNYYQLLFEEDIVHLGETYTRSREPYTPSAVGETADRWTHYIYNYLGDPELCMFRKTPDTFAVDFLPSVGFGQNEITVTVTSEGVPFDSAHVCLYKDGDDYIIGYTDILGQVVFPDFLCRTDGYIDVTVTGLDHGRFAGTISVVQETNAYLHVIKSKILASVTGNDDEFLDSGETVEYVVKLENSGGSEATRLYAILRSNDPDVVVTDSVTTYPDIAVNESMYGHAAFIFSVDPGVEDERSVEFTIDIHDSTGGFWSESFAVEVHAPELELFVNNVSDEPPYGDGDGIVTDGESFLLKIGVKNFGSGEAMGLEGKIRSLTGLLVVTDSTSNYGSLELLETGYGEGFVLYETVVGNTNYFTFELTDDFGRVYTRRLELRKPSSPINIILDASYGATEIHVTWHKPDLNEDYRYMVNRSLQSGTGFQAASTDMLFHSLFRDTGLLTSSWYYYTVNAVDSCGNLSDASIEAAVTTSPPQQVGWPNSVNKETASSPKIGDIDGDRHVDIVIGSKYVHAWRGDGVEIRDGDNHPITWGILNTLGDDFVATLALGELDGNPGLEIVGASWNTNEIHVFNHNGDNLPGFPKTTGHLCWASPVLGDFDGDGELDIIAYDVAGVVYAWHADGTEFRDGDSDPATNGPFFQAGSPGDGWHVSTPALADIDEDGILELIVCAPSSFIYCLNSNGLSVPGWPVPVDAGANISASPAVGDIDGDGHLEVVVQNSYARVYGLNHDGTNMTGWPQWVNSSTFFNGSPALADLTEDGKLEVIIPGMNGYLYIFSYTGASLPNWPQEYSNGSTTESTPLIADLNNDGSLDIVLGCQNGILNAWDIGGNYIPGFPIKLNSYIRGTPCVGDVDRDGDLELVASCWGQNVYIWDIDEGYYYGYAPWNGFHGNIFNNGWIDYLGYTDAEGLACVYELERGKVILNWSVTSDVASWDLYRQEGDNAYILLAKELRADGAGMIRYVDLVIEEGLTYKYRLTASGNGQLSVETDGIEIPVETARLYQNYPNPFNPSTRISFTVPGGSGTKQNVLLIVYDVRGGIIKTLVNEPVAGGRHNITWDGSNNRGEPVASGVYFSRLKTGGYREVKKMLLLR